MQTSTFVAHKFLALPNSTDPADKKRSQLTYVRQSWDRTATVGGHVARRLPRSKQIRHFPSLRIAL
jgi:hypothetical protein